MTKKLGFGCMRLPLLNEDDPKSIDIKQACEMVDTFIERGFTYFDTAYMYHNFQSEKAVKKILTSRHPRESYTLTTKLPLMFLKSEEDNRRIFDEQLEKCGVDHFDYYLLHNIKKDNYEKANKYNSFEFVKKLKDEGKVKHIGFSFHDTPELLEEVLSLHPELEFVQLQINYIDWDSNSIQSRKCYEIAQKYNMPVIVMEPTKGGSLASLPPEAEKVFKSVRPDMSLASWAIRFAASHDNIMMVLSGMSTLEQLRDNTSYMANFVPLSDEEFKAVDKVVDIINSTFSIACTSCQYCVDGCPKQIPIPKYFSLYNAEQHALNRGFSTQQIYYDNMIVDHTKASECIKCGQCEKACPQHLPIIKYLEDVTAQFEK